jgi:hypothetical protein
VQFSDFLEFWRSDHWVTKNVVTYFFWTKVKVNIEYTRTMPLEIDGVVLFKSCLTIILFYWKQVCSKSCSLSIWKL